MAEAKKTTTNSESNKVAGNNAPNASNGAGAKPVVLQKGSTPAVVADSNAQIADGKAGNPEENKNLDLLKNTGLSREERYEQLSQKNSKEVNKNYMQRLTYVKRGRDFFAKNDFNNAIYNYHLYFKAVTDFFNVDINSLNPELFDKEMDTAETLTISQVYWDLLRIYGMSPHLSDEFNKVLDLFINFSLGHKYQVLNSEMLRKYIKKNPKHLHFKSLQLAYQKIYIVSKNCYLAGHCFGEEHHITENIRLLKPLLLKSKYGHHFVENYYRVSGPLINFSKSKPLLGRILKAFLYIPLLLIAEISSFFIGTNRK